MDKEKLIAEVEKLRTMCSEGMLVPMAFDNLMVMLGGTTWAEETGEA